MTTTFQYDALGRKIAASSCFSSECRERYFAYNAHDQIIEESTGVGGLMTRRYDYFDGEGSNPAPTSSWFCGFAGTATEVQAQVQVCLDDLGKVKLVERQWQGTGLGASFAGFSSTSYGRNRQSHVVEQMVEDASSLLKRKTAFDFDASGNTTRRFLFETSATAPMGVAETYYDRLNRVVAQTDARFSDVADTQEENQALANRTLTYDGLGRVASVTVGAGTAQTATTSYEYDRHDNLTRVTDPDGRVTDYLYDDFDQLILVRSPDSGDTLYQYDVMGRLVAKKDATSTVTYEYDNRGRLTREFYDSSTLPTLETVLHYDEHDPLASGATEGEYQCPWPVTFELEHLAGRLAWVEHAAGLTFYSYTPFGEVAATYESAAPFDPCSMSITRYWYDDAGRLVTMVYPSGRAVSYTYGAGDLWPSGVQTNPGAGSGAFIENVGYDVDGRVASYDAGSTSFGASSDLAGRATTRGYTSGAASFAWQALERDGDGNLEQVQVGAPGQQLALTYDGQGRLETADGTGLRGHQDCSYSYDAAGNRTSETCYGKAITYAYPSSPASNALQSVTFDAENACGAGPVPMTWPFAPNAAGQLETAYAARFPQASDERTLAYNVAGRLESVTHGLDTTVYSYDHQGRRKNKARPDFTWVTFVYDGAGRLLAEWDDQRGGLAGLHLAAG